MLELFQTIGHFILSLYNVFDVKLFPDMPISLSQLILGCLVLIALLKMLFTFSNMFGYSTSIDKFHFGSRDSASSYIPHHAKKDYIPRHSKE